MNQMHSAIGLLERLSRSNFFFQLMVCRMKQTWSHLIKIEFPLVVLLTIIVDHHVQSNKINPDLPFHTFSWIYSQSPMCPMHQRCNKLWNGYLLTPFLETFLYMLAFPSGNSTQEVSTSGVSPKGLFSIETVPSLQAFTYRNSAQGPLTLSSHRVFTSGV